MLSLVVSSCVRKKTIDPCVYREVLELEYENLIAKTESLTYATELAREIIEIEILEMLKLDNTVLQLDFYVGSGGVLVDKESFPNEEVFENFVSNQLKHTTKDVIEFGLSEKIADLFQYSDQNRIITSQSHYSDSSMRTWKSGLKRGSVTMFMAERSEKGYLRPVGSGIKYSTLIFTSYRRYEDSDISELKIVFNYPLLLTAACSD